VAVRDIVVVGGSAGGVEALLGLVAGLPADLPAAVLIVMHIGADTPTALPRLLERAGPLPVEIAADGEPIRPGRIYLAPADRHLLVGDGRLAVAVGPREHGFRPAVDPLFRSAAQTYGARVIGVILSGGLDDGTLGLQQIKEHGGLAVVQRPDDAKVTGMPCSAIRHVQVDHVLPVRRMGRLVARLAGRNSARASPRRLRTNGQRRREVRRTADLEPERPTAITCPECGGALREDRNGDVERFRCHVGHGFTADSLGAEHTKRVEAALWTALRTLEESVELRRRLADSARNRRLDAIARGYDDVRRDAERRAEVIRSALGGPPAPVGDRLRRPARARRRMPPRRAG
jgi:two-component system chemotaxis response regulator CheB